jgi:UDP-N-acetylmuramate dehydrogenase
MPLMEEIRAILPHVGARLQADVVMATRSTFQIGGPADILFEPANATEIEQIAAYCFEKGVPLTVLGNGSNVLVSDRGIRGVVLVIGDEMSEMTFIGTQIVADAGIRLSTLAGAAARQGLSGLEFASGIPGTLGGAILMNAGAYGQCMADVVVLTEFLDEQLVHRSLVGAEHGFGYRCSAFSDRSAIILRACLKLQQDDPQAIFARIADLSLRRRASQPLDMPSAGSTFKRPEGHFAGKLISDCGLKGCRIGDAQVSEKHAGFIINLGLGCAADTRSLIEKIKREVAEKTGIHLEPEVRFVGEWQEWGQDGPAKE